MITTKVKKILFICSIVAIVIFLGILGTYLSNGNSWEAVVKLLTLPQCIVGYIIAGTCLVCLLLHIALRQDNYYD